MLPFIRPKTFWTAAPDGNNKRQNIVWLDEADATKLVEVGATPRRNTMMALQWRCA